MNIYNCLKAMSLRDALMAGNPFLLFYIYTKLLNKQAKKSKMSLPVDAYKDVKSKSILTVLYLPLYSVSNGVKLRGS